MFYFYKTTNLINGNYYYGSGSPKRKGRAKEYLGSGTMIRRAFAKHGRENFKIEKLRLFETRKEAFDFEDRFLKLYNIASKRNCYNMKNSGEGGDTFTNSPNKEQIRNRHSESNKERLKDPAERAKCNAFKDVTPEREAELKAIWSKAATGVKNGRCKYPHPVQQLDKETGLILKVWDSVFQARDGGGFSRKYIISASKSGGSHGGYCWKFIAVKTNKLNHKL